MPDDEWDAIALNYTSGTTGDPKGVVYHHRGAQPAGDGQRHHLRHGAASGVSVDAARWFHCNGWCFPGRGRSSPARMSACGRYARRRCSTRSATHKVTHLCGAPIVMSTLLNATDAERKALPHTVNFATAAASAARSRVSPA